MTNEELQTKYQGILELAQQNGTNYELSGGDDGVLHINGTAPSEEAKQQLWDKYSEIDPNYATGDLVMNIEVSGEAPQQNTYTVEAGDNLSKIGQKYGISWQAIYDANRDTIHDPDMIHPGQELKIPSA